MTFRIAAVAAVTSGCSPSLTWVMEHRDPQTGTTR